MKNVFKTKEGKIVVAQAPNPPIILWFLFLLLSRAPFDQALQGLFELLSFASLFTWAYLEITDGVNTFRRLLGVGVLVGAILLRIL